MLVFNVTIGSEGVHYVALLGDKYDKKNKNPKSSKPGFKISVKA